MRENDAERAALGEKLIMLLGGPENAERRLASLFEAEEAWLAEGDLLEEYESAAEWEASSASGKLLKFPVKGGA